MSHPPPPAAEMPHLLLALNTLRRRRVDPGELSAAPIERVAVHRLEAADGT